MSDGVETESDSAALQRSRDARARADGQRGEASRSRAESAQARELTSSTRDHIADERDRLANERDRVAQLRDELADARDASLADPRAYERGTGGSLPPPDDERAERDRKRAAAQRAVAAQDRERAALDRRHALEDRAHAARERTRAGFDALTGALRRGEGLAALEREVERAARLDEPLAVAFVDVDGLKRVNDSAGHGAGDALLRTVALQLRLHIRPYDLVVRLGGDEFLCGLPGAHADALRRLLEEVSVQLAEDSADRSISVGLAELGPDDSLEDLIERADADWRENHDRRR